eukprot:scpid10547/ scgid22202/ Serine/threonine-protein phosphatase 6 regulatory ankyrin repeat subunit C
MEGPEDALLSAAGRCDVRNMEAILGGVNDLDVNYSDREGMTPLMLCVTAKRVKAGHQLQCVKLLLESGVYLDSADGQHGRTATHWAVCCKNDAVLAEMLATGADVTCLDGQQLNIVHLAVECGAVQCIETMGTRLHAGFLDELDVDGITPLVRATRLGNGAVVKQLLVSGASPSLATTVDEQRNAVHWAAVCGEAKILAMMLKHNGDVRSVDSNQWTVAHLAAVHTHTACLEVLLKNTSELEFEVADHEGVTPLMLACRYGHAAHVKLMMKKKVSVLVADHAGWTALHHCAVAPNAKCVPVLAKQEAKLLERTDAEKQTPLQRAVLEGNDHVVDALVRAGASINVVGEDGKSLMHSATERGHPIVIQTLASHRVSVSAADASGMHPLHYAARMSATLPSHPDEVHEPGHSLRMQECLRVLLKLGAPVNEVDAEGQQALHLAASCPGNTTAIDMLLKSGADLSARDRQQLTTLHTASKYGVFDACNLLLAQYHAAVDATDEAGRTPLFYTVIAGYLDIAAILIDNGADLAHLDNEGMSVAHCAAAVGLIDFLQMLQSATPQLLSKASESGTTPVHEAAMSGESVCLEYLISAGCAVRCKLTDGFTPLHLAAEAGHYHCTALLLDAHAVVNSIAVTEEFEYFTPLDSASLYSEDDGCQELILEQGGCPALDIIMPALITIQRYARGMLVRQQLFGRQIAEQSSTDGAQLDAEHKADTPAKVSPAAASAELPSPQEETVTPSEQTAHVKPVRSASGSTGDDAKSSTASLHSNTDNNLLSSGSPSAGSSQSQISDRISLPASQQESPSNQTKGRPQSQGSYPKPDKKSPSPAPLAAAAAPPASSSATQETTVPVPPSNSRVETSSSTRAHENPVRKQSSRLNDSDVQEQLVFSVIPAQYEPEAGDQSEGDRITANKEATTPGGGELHVSREQDQEPHEMRPGELPGRGTKDAHTEHTDTTKEKQGESQHEDPDTSPQPLNRQPLTARQRMNSFLSRTSSIINPLNQYIANRRRSQGTGVPGMHAAPSSIAFLCAYATAVASSVAGEAVGSAALHISKAIAVGTLQELLERQRREAMAAELSEEMEGRDIAEESTDGSASVATGDSDQQAREAERSPAKSLEPGKVTQPDSSPSAEDVFRALEASRGPTLASQATQELVKTFNLQIKLQQELVEAELESERHILLRNEDLSMQKLEEVVDKEKSVVSRTLEKATSNADQVRNNMATAVQGAHKTNDILHKQLGAVGCPKRPTVAQWLQSKEKQRQAKVQQDLLAWDQQREQREVMLAAEKLLREERRQRHHGWEKIKSLQVEVRREERRMQELKYSQTPEVTLARHTLPTQSSPHRSSSISGDTVRSVHTAAPNITRAPSTSRQTPERGRFASAPGARPDSSLPGIQKQREVTPRRRHTASRQSKKKDTVMTTAGFVALPTSPPTGRAVQTSSQRRSRQRTEQYGAEDLWELAGNVASGHIQAPAVVDKRSLYPKKPATRRTGRRTLTFLPPDEYDALQREREQKELILGVQAPLRSRKRRISTDGTVTVMSRSLLDTESEISV